MSAAYEPVPPSATGPSATRPTVETPAPTVAPRIGGSGVAMLGIVTILVSAWGGIVPYVGPSFGYSADGSGSWHWNLAHALLALVPGVVGIVAGLSMISGAARVRFGLGRMSLTMAGFLAFLCGAWFVIGPPSWSVVESGRYFVTAPPLTLLRNELGWSFGPGVLLAVLGGEAMGWALRHKMASFAAVAPRARRGPRHLASVGTATDTSPVV